MVQVQFFHFTEKILFLKKIHALFIKGRAQKSSVDPNYLVKHKYLAKLYTMIIINSS